MAINNCDTLESSRTSQYVCNQCRRNQQVLEFHFADFDYRP